MKKLNQNTLRKLIREEVSGHKQYKHMSTQQKVMLEEGVVQKVVGAVKKVFGKGGAPAAGTPAAGAPQQSVGTASDNSPEGIKKEVLASIDRLLKRIPTFQQWDGVINQIHNTIETNSKQFTQDGNLSSSKSMLLSPELQPNQKGRELLEKIKKAVDGLKPQGK